MAPQFASQLGGLWVVIYKWDYKSPNKGYDYSYPTFNPLPLNPIPL